MPVGAGSIKRAAKSAENAGEEKQGKMPEAKTADPKEIGRAHV